MVWDVNKAVNHLTINAKEKSIGLCAQYVRLAIEAGGIKLIPTGAAKNYGPSLVNAFFREYTELPSGGYIAGDVVVIQPPNRDHSYGHMQMYSGSQWMSDFKQNGFWPGSAYYSSKPSFKVYRMPVVDNTSTPLSGIVSAPIHTLRQGDKGHDVLLLQKELISLGYRIADDGKFGPHTKEAVMEFQKNMLLVSDGIVGPKTWKALAWETTKKTWGTMWRR